MSLSDALRDADRRNQVIDDCVVLVDSEVTTKKGLGGAIIKTGYKAVKGIKPGFIRKVVDALFDEWVVGLDPIWAEAVAAGTSPVGHLETERGRVAEALLGVTDGKVARAKSALVAGTYRRLRPSAKEHVEQAVPALGALLARHAGG